MVELSEFLKCDEYRKPKTTYNRLLNVITQPKTNAHWFLRRIFLEGKHDAFNKLRAMLRDSGVCKTWGGTFWPAAREFGYESKASEQARCLKLETEYDIHNAAQVLMLKERQLMAEREIEKSLQRDDASSDYYSDVRWAFQNWARFLKKAGKEWVVKDPELLSEQAPSNGAYGLILYAADSLKDFQALASRVLSKVEVPENKTEEQLARADLGLEELKRVVEGL